MGDNKVYVSYPGNTLPFMLDTETSFLTLGSWAFIVHSGQRDGRGLLHALHHRYL